MNPRDFRSFFGVREEVASEERDKETSGQVWALERGGFVWLGFNLLPGSFSLFPAV